LQMRFAGTICMMSLRYVAEEQVGCGCSDSKARRERREKEKGGKRITWNREAKPRPY
jgi:hypothetical protein